jgi:hypothetical protein
MPSATHSVGRVLGASAAIAFALYQSASQQPRAQCGPNPIVCENTLTGAPESEWDISDAGDPSIQGFATSISVNKGETVHFKVDTTAAAFNIDIYRLGYYGGFGARKWASFTNITGRSQPDCLTNSATGLIDCGNWTESGTWSVPSTAVSGVYVAKLTRFDTGGASHIAFVVRDDAAQADIVFQTSDTTWQAYNTYGGNSLYVGGPASSPARAYKVSYNRPITTRSTSPEDWLFNAEYPTIRYLESNGFNVSYISGVDSDQRGATELKRHRLFLSVGHDEYWSGPQRTNVESARAAGVNLAFFSGNEVFWKTRWESSIDGTNTPYRTLVCYKETHANKVIDPLDPPTWTGTWRDKRFSPPADGGRPENGLTGTLFMVNSAPASTAIVVSGAYASQPFWRNTRVAKLSSTATTTLSAGTLGYEWDEATSNSSTPSGLTKLSSTTVSGVQRLQDNGSTYANGSATHSLTLYRHSSGALVFGAGTVQWAWALDGDHDRGTAPADLAAQQAMINLFADMGIGPGSLQPGLVPGASDLQPPTSFIVSPIQGASLPSGTPVTVSGTAADTGGGTVAKVEVSTNGGTSWSTATGTTSWTLAWTPSTQGLTNLQTRATDSAGNRETPSGGISVTVTASGPDTTPPSAAVTAPGAAATVAGTSVTLAATATDNVGVVGVQFRIDGKNVGAEDTASPYLMTWDTTGVADGGHSITVVARDAAGNTATSAAVAVTVVNSAPGPTVDVTAFGDRSPAATTTVTSAFSTSAANELLLAFIGSDQATASAITVSGVTGGGLTWQLVTRTNAQKGTAEIWRAFATAPLANVTVTATLTQSVTSSITVMAFSGVDTSGTFGSGAIGATGTANAATGAPSASLTPQRAKSLVVGVGVDYDNATSRTVGSGQSMVHQYLSPVGDTYWVQRVSSPTSASGVSVAVNDTAPTTDRYNLSVVEVVSPLVSDNTPPTVTISTPIDGATVSSFVGLSSTAADDIGVIGVQYKLDDVNLGAEVAATPYSYTWNTATAVNGAHTLTAVARDAAGHTTTSAPVHVTVNNVDSAPPVVAMTAPANNATVSGAGVAVSATATDDIGVVGVQFLLDGVTPLGAEVLSTPYSIAWDTTSVALGPHTLSARARDAAGHSTTSAAFNVTVAAPPSGPVVDATAFGDQPSGGVTTVTTNTFSTSSGNELLLAFVSADYSSGASTTVTGITGGGLTWQLVLRTNAQSGTAEIWRAFAPATLSGVSVTATVSQPAASSMTVVSFSGVDTTGTFGSGAIGATKSASASSGAPTASLVTTRGNSLVIGVGMDWDSPTARTLGANQAMVHQYMPPVGDTYWVQRIVGVVPAAGTTAVINATAPTGDRYNLTICEVLGK